MKLTSEDKELIEKAKEIIIKSKPVNLIDTSNVGSALITSKGNIFQGVCIGHTCGIGSCAEYQAIGAMISNGEKVIKTIVTVTTGSYAKKKNKKYLIISSCGTCREMIHQTSKKNWNTNLILSNAKKVKLRELLPHSYGKTIEK
jgi:cytidine deaminase